MDDDLLLDLLNTTPVVEGVETDALASDAQGRAWGREHDGTGSAGELVALRAVRADLQAVVRGRRPPESLAGWLDGVARRPVIGGDGVTWHLETAPDRRLPALAVLALGEVTAARPGRLRPCGNDECHLFFLDRSQAGRARWCSMSTCGNRMKARRHQARKTGGDAAEGAPTVGG